MGSPFISTHNLPTKEAYKRYFFLFNNRRNRGNTEIKKELIYRNCLTFQSFNLGTALKKMIKNISHDEFKKMFKS